MAAQAPVIAAQVAAMGAQVPVIAALVAAMGAQVSVIAARRILDPAVHLPVAAAWCLKRKSAGTSSSRA
jgi:hypothetical protein